MLWFLFCYCDKDHARKLLIGGKGLFQLTLLGYNSSLRKSEQELKQDLEAEFKDEGCLLTEVQVRG